MFRVRSGHLVVDCEQKKVTVNFMQRAQARKEPPVLWKFKFHHEDPKCVHVNFIDKTECEGEHEFLFPPYSVFTFESVKWQEKPNWERPHEIVLKVARDNQNHEEGLPLAPWG